jgi:hypothetical protein
MKYGLNCNIVTLYFYSIVRTQAKINEQAELINKIYIRPYSKNRNRKYSIHLLSRI